jgi:hypothetical protein
MSLIRLGLSFAMASGLALTACNRNDTASDPTSPAEGKGQAGQPIAVPAGFATEYQSLKSRERDPEKQEAGIRELLTRYGLPSADRAEARTVPGPMTLSGAEGESASGSLGKAAANNWYTVRAANFALDIVLFTTMAVPMNATLTVTVDHDPATSILDPFAVAYYKQSTLLDDPDFGRVLFAGIDDDAGGNNNSKFTWVNNTGVNRSVNIIGSAYLPQVAGVGTMTVTCQTAAGASCGSYSKTARMSGVAERSKKAVNPAGCSGPTGSDISLAISAGGDHGPGVLAVNYATKRGGIVYAKAGTYQLDEVLPYQYPSFVLGFSSGIGGFPCGIGVPSTCYEEPNAYTLTQRDRYSCP